MPAPDLLDDRPDVLRREAVPAPDEMHDWLRHDLIQGQLDPRPAPVPLPARSPGAQLATRAPLAGSRTRPGWSWPVGAHRDRHLRIALLELVAHRLVARASGVRPSGVGTERQGQRQQARAEHTEHGGSGFLWGEGPYHRSLLQLADRSGSAATAALRRSSRQARKTKARAQPVTTVTNHSKFIRRDGQ